MSETYEGGCLCGKVRFSVSGTVRGFFLCHCSRCRKGTGSAHAANLFLSPAELNWISGSASVTSYKVPDSRHGRAFCSECGAAVPRIEGQSVVVPAGSLDGDIAERAQAHVFVASRANWDEGLETLPHFENGPS